MVGNLTHLVVQKDADYCRHHAQDICQRDWVAQHQQWDTNDHDSLGGVRNGVAERTDEVEQTESDNVLGKVAEATEEEKEKRTRPSRNIKLGREQSDDLQSYTQDRSEGKSALWWRLMEAQVLTRSPFTRKTERSTRIQVGSMKITALKPRMLSSLKWWIRVSRNTF